MSPGRTSLVACVIVAVALVTSHIAAFRAMSPVDEIQHLDYVLRVRGGDLVHRGDLLVPETRSIVACRGFDPELSGMLAEGWTEPLCGAEDLRADQFPQIGFNTAWRHPPIYYLITAGLASGIDLLPGTGDVLTAARLAGLVWAIAAVCLMWALLAAFNVPRSNRVLLILFLIASPAVLFYLSVVTEDATAVAAGAGMLLAARAWQQGRAAWWLPVIVALGAGALKWTNLAGVVAAALYLVLSEALGKRERLRESGKIALGMVAACVFVICVWFTVQEAIAEVPPEDIPLLQQQQVASLDLGRTVSQIRQMLTPLRVEYLPDALAHDVVYLLVLLADLLLIVVLLVRSLIPLKAPAPKKGPVSKKKTAVVEPDRTAWVQPLALSVASVMLVAGAAFVVTGFVFFGVFNQVQPRFGLSLLPGAFVVMASVLRTPGGRIAIGSLAIATIAVVGLSLVAA